MADGQIRRRKSSDAVRDTLFVAERFDIHQIMSLDYSLSQLKSKTDAAKSVWRSLLAVKFLGALGKRKIKADR